MKIVEKTNISFRFQDDVLVYTLYYIIVSDSDIVVVVIVAFCLNYLLPRL